MPSPSMVSGRPKGRVISQASYELMVESHRRNLGDHAKAAIAGGVTYNTARKAWDKGLGKEGKKPPIRTIIGKDMTDLRAELHGYTADKLADARKQDAARSDMIDSKAMQARGVRMARTNGIALMTLSAVLLRSLIGLSNRLETLMNDADWRPTPKEAIALIKMGAEITKQGVDVAKVAEEMERSMFGGPDIIIGVQEMSPEQAVSVLRSGSRTLDRIKRRAERGDLPPALAGKVIDVEEPSPPSENDG